MYGIADFLSLSHFFVDLYIDLIHLCLFKLYYGNFLIHNLFKKPPKTDKIMEKGVRKMNCKTIFSEVCLNEIDVCFYILRIKRL